MIDPSDVEYPASLNLFDARLDRIGKYSPADRERVLNGVIELYELFFGAFLGAELTQKQGVIFKYLARLMLAIPDATIYTLMEIMEDGRRFKPYMDSLDGSARYFFEKEFFDPSFSATKKQIVKRLWGVLSTPAFDRMFGQKKNRLDLFEAMNDGKIILINTAKDLLKREGSQLFGRFFIAMIAQAALERSTLREDARTPVFVYVDEAHEYFDDSVEMILNQARKYLMSLTLAHQTLDQLSPRLRAALFSNTTTKCVGGASAKDASALAAEMGTKAEFLQSMRRTRDHTQFALWVKHLTPQAIRMTVPLGYLERQPTLHEEDLDILLTINRGQYCGKASDAARVIHTPVAVPPAPEKPQAVPPVAARESPGRVAAPDTSQATPPVIPSVPVPPLEEFEPGKGGPKHRYLQALVKQLGEQHGFRATPEAALKGGGRADVLLERDEVSVVFEISVMTPVAHEQENLKKCLESGHRHIAVVLAKSKAVHASYREQLLEVVPHAERERVSILSPEDIADYISSLASPPPTEKIVKGYRVRLSVNQSSPQEVRARREAIARVIARSVAKQTE